CSPRKKAPAAWRSACAQVRRAGDDQPSEREEPTEMRPLARESVAEQIEHLQALDQVAEPLQEAVRTLVPQESQLKDLLSGTWLGHPLHPPLTDVVVGAWTSALLLDLV